MQRHIQFRKWDTDEKYMLYNKPFYMDGRTDRFVYLQATGLKDKNGKEIYEGDVLLYPYSQSQKAVVRFYQNYACYRLYPTKLKSFDHNVHYSPTNLRHIVAFQLEVIGNIYQNPELIKG